MNTTFWFSKNRAAASMASCVERDSSRSSMPSSSNVLLLAAFGLLSCNAITKALPAHHSSDAVGVALAPQTPGFSVIRHLHRFGFQFALPLKDQVVQRRHINNR